MHAEFIDFQKLQLKIFLNNPENNIIAIGTTSLRTIESLYWLGVKTMTWQQVIESGIELQQWEAYELASKNISPASFEIIIKLDDEK